MNYLLDTNVISEWVKPVPDPRIASWLSNSDEDHFYLSVATLAEIRNGIELLPPSKRRSRLSHWLAHDLTIRFEGRIIDIDRSIAEIWGILVAQTQRKSITLSSMDAFIAATAKFHDLILVTRNIADFEQLKIALFNPWNSP